MADSLTCIVVTPEQTALEQKAEFISVPLYDGELGVLLGRAPLIGRLGKGVLRVRESNGKVSRYRVDGGFVQIQDNVVSLITEGFGQLTN
jgi:F-type H+-transporting ATPase subunit epsilon